ncbi:MULTISPECIES: phosphomannomutase/phosphoglucomutase [unclassified Brevibacterium]|uniref:phosphomannomutase/phosphoglucomutase n=1 Tax=unclassified Brevibacterium TaxID=2614124 RepID=UPI0010F495B3|nr:MULTISPECIES: phosphomannomutase/phosphoglucomutase [unclassified Brevibacterium]MCM1014086.1 phosphomannomutase/phosphoglucomutase [Brevibacterium sp. XM4083]
MTLPASRARALATAVGAYDIRGRIPDELDDDILFALGWATATAMAEIHGSTEVVVGHDMRPSSPGFAGAFAAGVAAAGRRPVLLGLCSTDQLYFASGIFDLPGAMITASHNPADYNGIKICGPRAGGVSLDSGLGRIRDLAPDAPAPEPEAAPVPVDERAAATMRGSYAQRIRQLTHVDGVRGLRVVVDCGNGMAGRLLDEVFGTAAGLPELDLDVIGLYTELDGTFPNHEANPLKPENLVDVQRAVVEYGADLGLAFDGDADRCFFIDETGATLSASAVGALVAEREITRARAAGAQTPAVIHNLITSRSVPEAIAAAGGRAIRSKVGHSGIKTLMREEHAVFACEHSAHFYFEEFYGADSGMLAACHLITALATAGGLASSLVAAYDTYRQSGEINFTVADPDAVLAAFAAAAADFGPGRIEELDGISVQGEDWWVNLRKSNTEPLVRLNVEAPDEARVRELTDLATVIVSGRAA